MPAEVLLFGAGWQGAAPWATIDLVDLVAIKLIVERRLVSGALAPKRAQSRSFHLFYPIEFSLSPSHIFRGIGGNVACMAAEKSTIRNPDARQEH